MPSHSLHGPRFPAAINFLFRGHVAGRFMLSIQMSCWVSCETLRTRGPGRMMMPPASSFFATASISVTFLKKASPAFGSAAPMMPAPPGRVDPLCNRR